MIYLKKFEDIKIPINVGDTILGGRFKNKKVVVKKIGKNAKGDITVNGKPLLKYRLVKESFEEETNDLLRSIMDMGMAVEINYGQRGNSVRIYEQIGNEYFKFDSPEFEWDKIRADVQAYISQMTEEFGFEIDYIYSVGLNRGDRIYRTVYTEEEILNDKELGMITCIYIQFKK